MASVLFPYSRDLLEISFWSFWNFIFSRTMHNFDFQRQANFDSRWSSFFQIELRWVNLMFFEGLKEGYRDAKRWWSGFPYSDENFWVNQGMIDDDIVTNLSLRYVFTNSLFIQFPNQSFSSSVQLDFCIPQKAYFVDSQGWLSLTMNNQE